MPSRAADTVTRGLDHPTSAWSRRLASVAALLIVLVTAALLPVAARPVGMIAALLPVFATIGIVTMTLTAILLYVRFSVVGDLGLAGLSAAYAYAAVLIVLHMVSFASGLANPTQVESARQGTVWLWTLWHFGFPLLVLASMVTTPSTDLNDGVVRAGRGHRLGLAWVVLAPLGGLVLGAVTTFNDGWLPPLTDDDPGATLRPSLAGSMVVLINTASLIGCIWRTRLRDQLSLWLAVALVAGLADTLLTLAGAARFSIGWYAARVQSVISATVVLSVLLWEFATLYRRLIESNRALVELALRDALTGAYNRGHFMEQLPREFRRACREGTALSLLMIDVDHFKQYNDSAGHPSGDRVLAALVSAFNRVLQRPGDSVSRYGGEEFAVVLPSTDAAAAACVARTLLTAVRGLALPRDDIYGPIVTISIGSATVGPYSEAEVTSDDLINRADDALYRAKRSGRDRIVAYEAVDALLIRREGEARD